MADAFSPSMCCPITGEVMDDPVMDKEGNRYVRVLSHSALMSNIFLIYVLLFFIFFIISLSSTFALQSHANPATMRRCAFGSDCVLPQLRKGGNYTVAGNFTYITCMSAVFAVFLLFLFSLY